MKLAIICEKPIRVSGNLDENAEATLSLEFPGKDRDTIRPFSSRSKLRQRPKSGQQHHYR